MAQDTSKFKNCCSGKIQYFCTETRRGKKRQIFVGSGSGVARLFDTRGEQSKWPPITEIKNIKKNIFIAFGLTN
jgi:hypothetical protein